LYLNASREARPTLPFIVVTRIPEMGVWLDALEAGATDYRSNADRGAAASLVDGIGIAPPVALRRPNFVLSP
jgi:hypothetical protein